jgi:hypothetical protein
MRALLAVCLGLGTLVSQAQTSVARIYIQTPQGVDLYTLSTANKLSLVSGSPFKTVGLGAGTNGKYWISVGTNILHVYAINQTTGAIGAQVSQLDTSLYSGAECGTTGPATLDHTGQFFYVQHWNTPQPDSGLYLCNATQAFKVASSGQMTFMGDNEYEFGTHQLPPDPINIVASGKLAYSETDEGWGSYGITTYGRNTSNGDLTIVNQSFAYPSLPGGNYLFPTGLTPDPSNHLVVSMAQTGTDGPYPTLSGPERLSSYTIGSNGALTTTNSYLSMPVLTLSADTMNMSPSGKILAVGGTSKPSNGPLMFTFGKTGLQLFHFNGPSPLTKYSSVLTTVPIDYIHWDNSNHVFALSASTGKLYVWTATPNTITPVSGSPFTIKATKDANGNYATALAVR